MRHVILLLLQVQALQKCQVKTSFKAIHREHDCRRSWLFWYRWSQLSLLALTFLVWSGTADSGTLECQDLSHSSQKDLFMLPLKLQKALSVREVLSTSFSAGSAPVWIFQSVETIGLGGWPASQLVSCASAETENNVTSSLERPRRVFCPLVFSLVHCKRSCRIKPCFLDWVLRFYTSNELAPLTLFILGWLHKDIVRWSPVLESLQEFLMDAAV